MKTYSIYMIFILICLIGLCVLQYYLSFKPKKWIGWILPIVFFCLSVLFTIQMVTFWHSYEISEVYAGNGKLMSSIITSTTSNFSMQPLGYKAFGLFMFCNIPTVALVIIYAIVHQKQKHKLQLNKMHIQDL